MEPVSARLHPTFFSHSLFVSPIDILNLQSVGNVSFELETGVNDDVLYIRDVNDGACNKRISCVGPEWSAGRPGNRPIGARDAVRNTETCLGPMPPTQQYSHRWAMTPVLQCKHCQEDHEIRTTPTSLQQVLQEELQLLKIAHRRRQWHCIHAGHHILLKE